MENTRSQGLTTIRKIFLGNAQSLAHQLETKLLKISSALEESSSGSLIKQKILEDVWQPQIQELSKSIKAYSKRAQTNPTLCVMGKRGQGKTSLLVKWLGDQKNQGIDEFQLLPTGDMDTTAALVRLTGVDSATSEPSPDFLHCTMLENDDLPEIKGGNRPPSTTHSSFRLSRNTIDIPPKIPFNICKFPDSEFPDKYKIKVEKNGTAKIALEGGDSLDKAQWHAKEVIVSVDLSRLDTNSGSRQLLEVLDIIDAPGADSQAQGGYPDWKKKKNGYVFQTAIKNLDILLIISASETSAIQLGGQFQSDIWVHWVNRCKGAMEGRLLLAFTKATEFFNEVKERIPPNSVFSQNEERNFARKIMKNVIEALANYPADAGLVKTSDPLTWPPIFFFEKERERIAEYTDGFQNNNLQELIEKLFKATENEVDETENWTLGQKCVIQMAKDFDSISGLQNSQKKAVKFWIIRSFCMFLNNANGSYPFLTELVQQYTTGGPVGRNHANERHDEGQQLAVAFQKFIEKLREPAGQQKTLQDLKRCQEILKHYFKKNIAGPELQIGEECRKRSAKAKENAGIFVKNRSLITIDDIIGDISQDSSVIFLENHSAADPEDAKRLTTAFKNCLKYDPAVSVMGREKEQSLRDNTTTLKRIQVVGLERIVRIADYIANADQDGLMLVASKCYNINTEEADLIKPLVDSGVAQWTDDDKVVVDELTRSHKKLIGIISEYGWCSPYAVAQA